MAIIGHLLNLLGIIVLFFFGMPFRTRTGGAAVLTADPEAKGTRTEALYDKLNWLGLALLVLGTILLIASD